MISFVEYLFNGGEKRASMFIFITFTFFFRIGNDQTAVTLSDETAVYQYALL